MLGHSEGSDIWIIIIIIRSIITKIKIAKKIDNYKLTLLLFSFLFISSFLFAVLQLFLSSGLSPSILGVKSPSYHSSGLTTFGFFVIKMLSNSSYPTPTWCGRTWATNHQPSRSCLACMIIEIIITSMKMFPIDAC